MFAVGLIVAVFSAVFSVMAAVKEANRAQDAANYNAKIAESQAQAERDKAAFDEARYRENAAKVQATSRTRINASGVDITEGTPLAYLSGQSKDVEMDAMAIRYGGEIAAQKAQNQANSFKYQGEQAWSAGQWKAGSSLMSSAGSIGGIAAKM
jgi:hypothetical protein